MWNDAPTVYVVCTNTDTSTDPYLPTEHCASSAPPHRIRRRRCGGATNEVVALAIVTPLINTSARHQQTVWAPAIRIGLPAMANRTGLWNCNEGVYLLRLGHANFQSVLLLLSQPLSPSASAHTDGRLRRFNVVM